MTTPWKDFKKGWLIGFCLTLIVLIIPVLTGDVEVRMRALGLFLSWLIGGGVASTIMTGLKGY
jgi:hypothetical protein